MTEFQVVGQLGLKTINCHVIPAKAGIQTPALRYFERWIPAFAGMTCIN